MSKHQAQTEVPKASDAASGAAKSEPIVILDANDGTPLIIVPTDGPGGPAKAPRTGAGSAPGLQNK